MSLTDILENKNGNIEQYKEIISVIGRNARRLKHLTEDILDVSRIAHPMIYPLVNSFV